MEVIKQNIGDVTVFIQAVEVDAVLVGTDDGLLGATTPTSTQNQIEKVFEHSKQTIKAIAQDIGSELKSVSRAVRPTEVEMEFNIAVSTQFGAVLIGGKGETSLKVKLMWDFSEEKDAK